MKPPRLVGRGVHAAGSNYCVRASGYLSVAAALAATDTAHDKLWEGNSKSRDCNETEVLRCTGTPRTYMKTPR